jgi:hypothetical protein
MAGGPGGPLRLEVDRGRLLEHCAQHAAWRGRATGGEAGLSGSGIRARHSWTRTAGSFVGAYAGMQGAASTYFRRRQR